MNAGVIKKMLDIENFDRKFESIIRSEQWKSLEKSFCQAEFVFVFGNGGNMGVADHAATDISRLTDKNAMCPGSGVTATSIIGDTDFESWFRVWLTSASRGIDPKKCLALGMSCSTVGASSNSIVNALNWAVEKGMSASLFSAQPKENLSEKIIPITQHAKFYHTSEILSLALTYQLTHAAGFDCPTISKKAQQRRFEKLGIQSEVETNNKHVPPGMESQLANIAVDFDGVIHNFDKGWHDGTCYGEPISGSLEALKILSNKYNVIVFSAKVRPDRPLVGGKTGYELVDEWLQVHNVRHYVDEITHEKPRAAYYIDDKAIKFENNWEQILGDLS
jgi:phosphoheptose isomerase